MKRVFIVNPNAGRGKGQKIISKIESVCKTEKLDYEIRLITKNLSGAEIASEYKEEENIIFVVGGDGTITKTISGIAGTKNKLGIIPAGSGNDTYKTVKKLPKGDTSIDLAKINDIYFINVACLGIDAEVANNLDVVKKIKIPTSQLYNASIFYTFAKFKFKKMSMKTSVKNIEAEYTILSVCNGGFYGGGYNIAPKSELTDGLLDVYFAEKMSRFRMIPLILKMKKGKHEGKRRVHKFRTNHIEIKLEEEVTFNVDGDKVRGNKFILEVEPKAIIIHNDIEFVNKIME